MPSSWNEIKDRALAFSREWKGERAERAEAQSFWKEFFDVFGVKRRRVAVYEKAVAGKPQRHGDGSISPSIPARERRQRR